MKRTPLLAILLAVIVLQSCQKEIDPTTPNNPTTPATTDSTYLWKVLIVDTTVLPLDTTLDIQINYDAGKRVTSIFSPPEAGTVDSSRTEFFYNGSDTLPYKSVEYVFVFSNGIFFRDTTTGLHYYDVFGRKIKDSIYDKSIFNQTKLIQYTYSSGKIHSVTVRTSFDPLLGFSYSSQYRDTALLDIKNNIVSHKNYEYDSAQSRWYVAYQGNFTYDNNPNPFYKLTSNKAIKLMPEFESFIESEQPNNARTYAQVYFDYFNNSTTLRDDTQNHKYRPNGLPKETFGDGPNKLLYVYKAF